VSVVPQQTEPAVVGECSVISHRHSADFGKEAGYNLPGGVGKGGEAVSASGVAAGLDQPMAVSREVGGVSAFCTRSTARPPDVVDFDRRGGDVFRSSAPDALSSQGGVGARAQKSPVQAGCRGERCSRPTDARDKDGPDAMISSQSKESPADEIVQGEGGMSRRNARGLRCTRRRCPDKGGVFMHYHCRARSLWLRFRLEWSETFVGLLLHGISRYHGSGVVQRRTPSGVR